jgi:hypothetical protein
MKSKKKSLTSSRFAAGGLLILALLLILSFAYSSIHAQLSATSKGLEVSPPTQEVTVDPGKSIDIKAKVTNKSDSDAQVKVTINNITSAGDEGQVALTDKANDIASWAKVDNDSFSLKSGETKEVTATITVPADAAGGHYGSFVFTIPGQATPQGPGVAQEVASLFLVRVNGPVNETISLEQFNAPSFVEYGPVKFDLKFKNSGNVHVKPQGIIDVTDMFGKKVADIVVNGQNIFPGAERIMDTNLDKGWLIGPYKATAILYYGSTNESLVASTSFFAFPVRVAAAVLLVLVALYLLRKRLSKALSALGGK